MRSAYVALAGLMLLLILVQFLLAGFGMWGVTSFEAHEGLGYTALHGIPLIMLIVAAIGRLARDLILRALLLFVLLTVQVALPNLDEDAPGLTAFHPLLALVIFVIVHATFQRARVTAAAPAGGAAAAP
jgi:hypothetical protein